MPDTQTEQMDLPGTDHSSPDETGRMQRVRVDGKFFRIGRHKFHPRGVAYGPFAPNADGEPFPERDRAEKDFHLIRELGANLIRIYDAAPLWLLDLARKCGLKVFIDIPWSKHACFLDSREIMEEAREKVSAAVRVGIGHPAVFAYSVMNEVSPDVVRWSGVRAVEHFIDELIDLARKVDPDCLCTFGNFPPTEFLHSTLSDFDCFNVYLHRQPVFENYLTRLQMMAGSRPLLLGETGVDSLREGEMEKCRLLSWKIETAFRRGAAGVVVFSFTDDWHRNGQQVEDWEMGLTTREREPKLSWFEVQRQYQQAPYFPMPRIPRVSVVVASYEGAKTLGSCLKALSCQNYPDFEIILVDDGSTDDTCRITSDFREVRYVHQDHSGLSVARNTGIEVATGEVIAFTDADCRPDEDWLFYLMGDLLQGEFVGIGGHNFMPPEDSWAAAAVMASPGGPAHVMLNDRVAEHVPGCNMAFYKWALNEINGFDPLYHRAGDDVDICWRLQQRGYEIGFSPSGFVWHYRRSNIRAYLAQQSGYGEAEALLVRRHPEYFNIFGGSVWRGRIYSSSKFGPVFQRSMIYHGTFGSGWFQTLYQASPAGWLMFCTSLEYHVLVNLPLLLLTAYWWNLLPLLVTSIGLSTGTCVVAGLQAELPPDRTRLLSRPLVALLYFLQPIVRGWARYRGRLVQRTMPEAVTHWLESLEYQASEAQKEVRYLAHQSVGRIQFLKHIIEQLDFQGWQNKSDAGWSGYDVEVFGNRWCSLQLLTVSEPVGDGYYRIKCRLQTVSSLLAKVTFWAMLAMEMLAIGFLHSEFPWVWLLLLSLPVFGLFLDHKQKNLQRLVALFLDDVARKNRFTKLDENNMPAENWVHPSDAKSRPAPEGNVAGEEVVSRSVGQ